MITDHTISAGGIRTSYCESGTGEPIVFLHGAGFGAEGKTSFIEQLNGLSDRFRVIAVDQLHFGGTDYPADGKYITRIGRVDHVIAFLEAMGLKGITLAGHSEGSFVAARVAIVRPDLVSRLILLTSSGVSPAFGDDRDEAWVRACRARYDYSGGMPGEDEFVEARMKDRGSSSEELDQAQRAAYRRAAARGQYAIFENIPEEEDNPRLYVRQQQEYIIPYLDELQARTLIIWSKNDATVPPERGLMVAKLIRDCDFHLLGNAGHGIQFDRAATVNRLIREWLQHVNS